MESPARPGADVRQEIEDSLAHMIPQEPFSQYVDDTVFLDIKELLGQHPDKPVRAWAENPRLYTLLRMLGHDDETSLFKKLDGEKIGDFWLPLASSTLNQLSSAGLSPSPFRRTQLHILSKPELMSEDKLLAPVHTHRHILYASSHFEEMERIGKGGSAEVARVRHKLSGKQFACKRILRAETIKGQRNQLVEFEQEVGVLQRISHRHFVNFVASFTDLSSFSLILNPVAKDVLKNMLERQTREQPLPDTDISTLRQSLGCLATALAYLHEQRVRHKDIKPGNILLSDGRVYLCDFGISRDWSKSEHSTTEGDVLKFTRRYCAPEVFGRDPRNTKSDIWSLGCVFLELISVIKGYPLTEINNFILEYSAGESAQGLWCAPEAMKAWLVKIRSENNDSADDLPLDLITPMIRTEPEDRLKASDIVDMIHKQAAYVPHPGLFIASCCSRSDSIAPIRAVDSPTLAEPAYSDLGISNASASASLYPHRPQQNDSLASIERGGSRDRSVSPRTHSRRGSTDTVPFPIDPLFSPTNNPIRRISLRSDSQQTSSYSVPQAPESIVSSSSSSSSGLRRSPVPPPASFNVKCNCASRVNEKHIFNAPFTYSAIEHDKHIPNVAVDTENTVPSTVETCAKCETGENRVQIYETPPEDPNIGNAQIRMLWWINRRLVISYLSGTPEMRRCSSFWLPLADLQYISSGREVTLRWSDCNQVTERRSGNYSQHYDWIYNPKQPNNSLTLRFIDSGDAQRFIDTVRLPYEDGDTVSHGRRINVSNSTEVHIFDIGRQGSRNYRAAVLTTAKSSLSTSKLFIQWPELDLDIRIRHVTGSDHLMTVECKNVSKPTYHSDVRGEPAADYNKVARFNKALKLKSSFAVPFPIGVGRDLPAPPPGVVDMLYGLTGWKIRYFAIVYEFKSKRKRFGSKNYGRADILLWDKEVDGNVNAIRRRGTQVTFRQHEEMDFLWTSATITSTTSVSYSTGFDATITVANKTHGRLLDVTKMTAIMNETPKETRNAHTRSISDTHNDMSDLVLTFRNARYRLEFVKLIEEFKAAATAAAPLARIETPADSVREINSLASSDTHMSLPIR